MSDSFDHPSSPDRPLQNQTALVTGGTRGIGAAISEALLAAGASVTALYHSNPDAAEAFRERVAARITEDQLALTRCDVSDHDAVEQLFSQWEGPLQILVNNAGIRADALVGMMSKASWDRVLSVNLDGAFHTCKYAVRKMVSQRYGRIINISSPAAHRSHAGQANYAAAKAGLVAMTRTLALEVATRGVTVNAVAPGYVETDMLADIPAARLEQMRQQVPLGRFGTPEEIAAVVVFLASPVASYVTATTISATGGL